MFCFQCQEAAGGKGCQVKGVCGKENDVANMQDLLMYALKGIAFYQNELEPNNDELNRFVTESIFATITNANYDKDVFIKRIKKAIEYRKIVEKEAKDLVVGKIPACATFDADEAEFEKLAATVGVLQTENEDLRSLRELLTYGLKGIQAYHEHAQNLGFENCEIHAFTYKALKATVNDSLTGDDLTALCLECGKHAVEVMALLDKANTDTYGHPELTEVNLGVRNNPAILISGHDLKDLEELLKQTEGSGVDVYTHSEMLPGHYYPAFKKYDHFVGNYGNAWWKQKEEFEAFNGPILFTTNCIVPPLESYKKRVYTTGASGFAGCTHIADRVNGKEKDFSQIIEHAKKCEPPKELETGKIVGGFAHNQVLALADKVVEAVKSGAVKKFVVMAGCDGRMKSREYYTEFAEKLPKDTIILTAGCAKYRYNKLNLGDIGGIPRVLDAGQCNDSYSLAVIALKLKEVFGLDDINKLPIVYNIAWYEQKAVTVLLALLHLGVKNIHLGPTLPAFLSPNVTQVLIDNFGIGGITTADEDLETMLG
jgi:hydroxylamine reductase